jgi:hypothetical protein
VNNGLRAIPHLSASQKVHILTHSSKTLMEILNSLTILFMVKAYTRNNKNGKGGWCKWHEKR